MPPVLAAFDSCLCVSISDRQWYCEKKSKVYYECHWARAQWNFCLLICIYSLFGLIDFFLLLPIVECFHILFLLVWVRLYVVCINRLQVLFIVNYLFINSPSFSDSCNLICLRAHSNQMCTVPNIYILNSKRKVFLI